MKIHDKFVIELAEVIKSYGNDYRVEEPFHLPCDYKFYEIGGVAICEESFKKMKPLESEINAVLDKIRAEIENDWQLKKYPSSPFACGLRRAIEIIDKYKAEGEEGAEAYPISEDISKGFEEFTRMMFKQGTAESEDKE